MGDTYAPALPRRWRILLVVASVVVSVPFVLRGPVTIALVTVQAAALWWLDRRPLAATAVVLVVSAGLQALVPAFGPGIAFVVLCTCAWLCPAARTWWVTALAVLAVCGPPAARGRWDLAGLALGGVLLAWSWGALARARGARRRAERRQAVLEERARIARELHDVLSHTVSVMVVQAAAADDVFDLDPAKAREAVRRTEEAGRQALTELRWFLRTVRSSGEDGSTPQPGLADVERLAATMTDAGLPVSVECRGSSAEVPLSVQLNAYRIVQEALTNTLRHARASRADVLLEIGESSVHVRVRDDGTAVAGRSGGHGLNGMRERADLLGGTLQAGPRPSGGFEVEARLPVRS